MRHPFQLRGDEATYVDEILHCGCVRTSKLEARFHQLQQPLRRLVPEEEVDEIHKGSQIDARGSQGPPDDGHFQDLQEVLLVKGDLRRLLRVSLCSECLHETFTNQLRLDCLPLCARCTVYNFHQDTDHHVHHSNRRKQQENNEHHPQQPMCVCHVMHDIPNIWKGPTHQQSQHACSDIWEVHPAKRCVLRDVAEPNGKDVDNHPENQESDDHSPRRSVHRPQNDHDLGHSS
mmetsp:Transcript_1573/g.3432  ORF Transcript_1573/g.3432 Transcript_1573/m.3432 type:complete len:232 (-) Transcript_1573:635-1330(-)